LVAAGVVKIALENVDPCDFLGMKLKNKRLKRILEKEENRERYILSSQELLFDINVTSRDPCFARGLIRVCLPTRIHFHIMFTFI
jgi:hypothetical protein